LKQLKRTYNFADSTESTGQISPIYIAIPEKIIFFRHFSLKMPLICGNI
jgi:hypothetical protein